MIYKKVGGTFFKQDSFRVSEKTADRIAFFIIGFYALATSALSLLRHANFRSLVGDLAVHSQVIWGNLHGDFMRVTLLAHLHHSQGPISYFNLHFSPILLLITPLFLVAPLPEGLIALKCVSIAAAGGLLYCLAKKKLWPVEALGILLLFLGAPQSLSCVHDSFHVAYLAPLLFFALYASYLEGKKGGFILFLFLFCTLKESYPPTAMMLGAYFLATGRDKRMAVFCLLASFGYGLAVMRAMEGLHTYAIPVPSVSFRAQFFEHLNPSWLAREFFGKHLADFLWFMAQGAKGLTFLTWACVLWFPQILIRLTLRIPYGDHYGTLLVAIMMLTLPLSLERLWRMFPRLGAHRRFSIFLGIFILGAATSFDSLKILSPENYQANPHRRVQREALGLIPKDASVTTSEMYATWLSTRRFLDFIGHEALNNFHDYVLIDLNREDNTQNEWPVAQNFWKPFLESSRQYELIFDKENIRLYRKKRS